MSEQGQTKMKQALIATNNAINQADPTIPDRGQAQMDDPQIRQASGDHLDCMALEISEMTFIHRKATALFIREERFDPKAFFVPITNFVGQINVGDEKIRL